jgi:hypothetical protein
MLNASHSIVAVLCLSSFAGLSTAQDSHANAKAHDQVRLTLGVPALPFASLPSLLPQAEGIATVDPGDRTDRLHLKVTGLPANLNLVVFLTELPVAPFGAVQYIADMKTNDDGEADVTVKTLIFEAFAFSLGGPHGKFPCTQSTPPARTDRAQLDHIVIWPADPVAFQTATGIGLNFTHTDVTLGGTLIRTPFDSDYRDGSLEAGAGPAILSDNPTNDPALVSPLASRP